MFEPTTRNTRLFPDEIRRVFFTLELVIASTKAAAAGYRGTLRLVVSDGIDPLRLAALLARCREDKPDVKICLFEISLTEQVKGLRRDLYDARFAQAAKAGEGIHFWYNIDYSKVCRKSATAVTATCELLLKHGVASASMSISYCCQSAACRRRSAATMARNTSAPLRWHGRHSARYLRAWQSTTEYLCGALQLHGLL
ncbi:MAG: hypothetical protein ACYCY7_04720 [Gallionella sp.]